MGIHMTATPSTRAQIVEARTYLRPLDDAGTVFETPEQAADRIIGHQRWLWERAKGGMHRVTEVSDLPPLKFDDPVGYRVEDGWVMIRLTDAEEAELQELKNLFLDRKLTVSGRTRWLGGTTVAKERESTHFNCSFLEIRNAHDVVDATWLLLQGCGVGFRPVIGTLNGFAQPMEIEVIRSQRGPYEKGPENNVETFDPVTKTWTIKVGDSSSAWAKSAGKLVAGKYHAKKLVLDFSLVRGGGGRLKNYGWISSGDAQIAKAYKAIALILNEAAGRLLTRIEILDILNWLGTILSSRRSAEIAVIAHGEPEWQDFALAKKDMWTTGRDHRQMSNNSIMFYQKPTKYQLSRMFKMMMDAGGSEPGFINAQAAMKRAPWFKGVNPCVPGETPILTRDGYVPIKECVGKPTEVWNGNEWSLVTPYSTGVNPLVRVALSDGTSLDCTPYHNWVIKPSYRARETRVVAKDLKPGMMLAKFDMPVVTTGVDYEGDAYSQGFYSGDGNTDLKHSWVYEPKFSVIPRLCGVVSDIVTHGRVHWKHGPMRAKNWVPHGASLEYRLNWLAGLFDADGTVVRDINGNGLQLSACDLEFLCEVRLLLTTVGVQAKLNLMSPAGKLFDGYECQECWRLLVNASDVCRLISEVGIQFSRLEVHGEQPQRDARRFVTVLSVTPLEGEVETFCFTEPKNHTGTFNGIVTGQCAEIMLGDRSMCNLAETVLPRFNDDIEGLHRAHWLVARANYRQTCVNLDDGVLQRGWHELNEFLRLCGVGVTGVVSWDYWRDPAAWEDLRYIAVNGTHSMADELGLPRSKAVTTVKPSGTQSKALGIVGHEVPEGIHMPIGRFIFNRIRFSAHDPIIEKLRAANYDIEPDPSDETGVLAVIPVEFSGIKFGKVKRGGKTIEVNTETALEQLERYKLLMDNYVDHNASITITYDPEEVPDIVDWLMANWDSYVGVSFIYRQDATRTAADLGYKYLPQTLVDKDTYQAYTERLLPVDLSGDAASEMLADSMECAGGACPVR